MHLGLTIASFEELAGVFLREEERLARKHRQQVGESETAQRGHLDVGFQLVKRIAIVFHPVGQDLADLFVHGGFVRYNRWGWGDHWRRDGLLLFLFSWLDRGYMAYFEVFSILFVFLYH